ncbi:hypothetical protein LXT21_29240 [Myxococcus sp. K38C18041901]|uniref:hypothetical protein n=1 Tax=Myxococcus guangdongensis TaxID=2906760 RepID=UPI0020A73179|nr:hypothetical protein [Myxococcus guangdongensis]MCP3062877.1 hypothetical protein [Myxococcus guangdongensis]
MRDLSALETGGGWCLRDEVSGAETRLRRPRGLPDLCDELSKQWGFLPHPWSFEGQVGQTRVRLALQWCSYQHKVMRSWVNLRWASEGGTHLQGFRLGLRKALRARLNARAPQQEASLPSDEELEQHLTVVLDLRLSEPVWHGPSGTKLTNPETKSEVAWLVAGWLEKALADNSAMEDRVLSTLGLLRSKSHDLE